MKAILSLAAALALASPVQAAEHRERREVGAFSGIAVAAPIDVEVAQSDADSVVLEGDAASIAALETEVRDGVLHIRVARREGRESRIDARARVTARRVERLSVAGAGDIRSGRLEGEALRVHVAGSGDVRIAGGRMDALSANIAGSGDVDAHRLEARTVKVSVAGSGDARVHATEILEARVAGSGDIRYAGNPSLQVRIAGSGSVERLRSGR